jgi:hypothetical protein
MFIISGNYLLNNSNYSFQKPKCLSVPTLPAKVELHIKTCQSEVKSNIIDDLIFTTLNEKPYSSAEYSELFKSHVKHRPHKSKHNSIHSSDQLKKSLAYAHSFDYFEPDLSQALLTQDEFVSLQSATASTTANHYNEEPSLIDSLEHSTFPEYVIDHSYHITPSNQYVRTPATKEVQERQEMINDEKDKVIEAREELMKILANHKIVERQISRKDSSNNHAKINSTAEILAKRSRPRSKRGLFEYFNRNKNGDLLLRRSTTGATAHFHPMLVTEADRWLAGCLMQCIFRKTHALDKHGYPTLDGIIDLYTEGIHDQFYFMYALRAVNKCLKIVSRKHQVQRSKVPLKAETCEIAYGVFDCVSDAIAAYCH